MACFTFQILRSPQLLSQESQLSEGRLLKKYLKPDLLIIDDMGLKILPQKSGEILLEQPFSITSVAELMADLFDWNPVRTLEEINAF